MPVCRSLFFFSAELAVFSKLFTIFTEKYENELFWFHHTVLMILTAVAMVFEIEMLIDTCYILTEDGTLRIESGRFVPDTEIETVR